MNQKQHCSPYRFMTFSINLFMNLIWMAVTHSILLYLTPNFNLDVLYLKNLHCVTWSLSCKQIYHGIKWHSLGEKKISTLFTKAVNIYALALSKYKITYNHFLNEVWLSFIFKSSLILKMQWSYTWSYIYSHFHRLDVGYRCSCTYRDETQITS